MDHPGNSLDQDAKRSNLRRFYNFRCKENDQSNRFEKQKRLIKISTEQNFRYIKLDLIENERRNSVPQLNLLMSPLILRRQLQKNHQISPTFQSKAENMSQQETQLSLPIKRSKYVLEIEKVSIKQQASQYEKTLMMQYQIQRDAFRDYNRYKMLTNEHFVWLIFIILVIFYKIVCFILQDLLF